jgi:hypothetical protein
MVSVLLVSWQLSPVDVSFMLPLAIVYFYKDTIIDTGLARDFLKKHHTALLRP